MHPLIKFGLVWGLIWVWQLCCVLATGSTWIVVMFLVQSALTIIAVAVVSVVGIALLFDRVWAYFARAVARVRSRLPVCRKRAAV